MIKATVLEEGGGTAVIAPQKRGRGRPRKEESLRIAAEKIDAIKPKRKRFEIPAMETLVKGEKKIITFPLDKDFLAEPNSNNDKNFTKTNGKTYFLLPKMSDFAPHVVSIGDSPNPRSHNLDALRHPIAKAIQESAKTAPEAFHLLNRGITILVNSLEFKNGNVEIELTSPNLHGICDGGTTSLALFKLHQEILKAKETEPNTINFLETGRVYIKVIVGLNSHEMVEDLVAANNSSRSVKGWSMAAFRGQFDFLVKIVQASDSPLKDRVAFDETGDQEINAIDLLSLLTLFQREFQDNPEANPALAYANKGKLHERLSDENLLNQYKALSPLAQEIFFLHDYIYSTFSTFYTQMKGEDGAKLGRRPYATRQPVDDPYVLPLSGLKSNYKIDNSIVYLLLFALTPLVRYSREGIAKWRKNPKNFYDQHATRLISHLVDLVDNEGSANKAGKSKLAYQSLAKETQILLSKEYAPKED